MTETIINEQNLNVPGAYITNVITDGPFKKRLAEHMRKSWSEESINSVFSNATQALLKFISPKSPFEKMTKLLCLGKVQSGKTAFFISSIALAFDNGYDIVYVIGGTKNNLLSQNKDRILDEFSNNDDILIMDINNANPREIKQRINCGCKVILMVLKHKSKTSETNLSNLEKLTSSLCDIPSLIVDDEGDEYSPGDKKKTKQVSNAILNCVNYIKRGTYLSVTATPQSNLLLSTTLENLSPDDCVLVEPGNGYTGANVFHDSLDNPLVKAVSDTADFDIGIPNSFCEALKFYLIGCAVRVYRGDNSEHSMLIHPSSKTSIQKVVYDKVKNELDSIILLISDKTSFGYNELIEEFKDVYNEFDKSTGNAFPEFSDLMEQIKKNLNRTRIYQINTRDGSSETSDVGMEKFYKYKIYVGGNMLERGITIKNLSVTYIYRSAKENPVDNTLQRARWFGYKKKYLDLCRVYMTNEMKKYFIDINDHENYLWQTIKKFLKYKLPLKKMKRVFKLSNKNLILTRKSVSKTIKLGTLNQGYSYNRSLYYKNDNAVSNNLNLLNKYFSKLNNPKEYVYGRNNEHRHIYFENISFIDFFENVIKYFEFPLEANVNFYTFETIKDTIEANLLKDEFTLIRMRDGENQYRSTIANGMSIKELPESYQVTNGYIGDKAIFKDRLNVQVHYVYTDKNNKDNVIPFLTINNPSEQAITNYVTGENSYEN